MLKSDWSKDCMLLLGNPLIFCPTNRAGNGGTGGTSSGRWTGPERGVPKLQRDSTAAAKLASSSSVVV